MARVDHEPAAPEVINESQDRRAQRYGLTLFGTYFVFYSVFVLLNAYFPSLMERTVFGGINVAVWYGLGLIAAAFFLALVYAWLCGTPKPRGTDDQEGGQ